MYIWHTRIETFKKYSWSMSMWFCISVALGRQNVAVISACCTMVVVSNAPRNAFSSMILLCKMVNMLLITFCIIWFWAFSPICLRPENRVQFWLARVDPQNGFAMLGWSVDVPWNSRVLVALLVGHQNESMLIDCIWKDLPINPDSGTWWLFMKVCVTQWPSTWPDFLWWSLNWMCLPWETVPVKMCECKWAYLNVQSDLWIPTHNECQSLHVLLDGFQS
jgi:hypothetical protein